MQINVAANNNLDLLEYGTIQWLRNLLVFNMRPSLSLHPDHLSVYDNNGMWSQLLDSAPNKAIVHRHWSEQILNALDIKDHVITPENNVLLQVALLPTTTLQQLMAWLGLQLCADQIRNFIHKQQLGELLNLPHYKFVQAAQNSQSISIYKPAMDWCSTTIAQQHINLGYSALLNACQSIDPASSKLLTLKLPKLEQLSDLPDADHTFQICLMFLQR